MISNWFSVQKRGLVMGLWAPSAAVGNIVGQQIAGLYFDVLDFSWEQCLLTYASLMLVSAALFAILVTQRPNQSLLAKDERGKDHTAKGIAEFIEGKSPRKSSISFWKAWLIPG